MPHFYFDIERGPSKIADDEGCELASVIDAQQLGLELLGEAIIHGAFNTNTEVCVEVRTQDNSVLQLNASISISCRESFGSASRMDAH